MQHLALAWLAVNPNTSTVILGASRPEQIVDNLKALDVMLKLTPEILEKVEKILDNRPAPYVRCLFWLGLGLQINSFRSLVELRTAISGQVRSIRTHVHLIGP